MEPRLKAELWVKALMRRAMAQGVAVYQRYRGQPDAGAVLVVAGGPGEHVVYARGLLTSGQWGWRRATGPKPVDPLAVETYLERQRKMDPDLWVIELETADFAALVDDPVEAP